METIKEEKKADLEQLLNSLIDKGWKPRWLLNEIEYIHAFNDVNQWWRVEISYGDHWYYKALRQIVSKESWLWQFVCENELVKPVVDIISICSYSHFTDDHDDGGWDETFPEYRLIESALKDENELEDFLLKSIKLDEI